MSSLKLKLSIITGATTLFLCVGQSNALTLKSGEVLGGDGKVYADISPEQLSKLEKNFQRNRKKHRRNEWFSFCKCRRRSRFYSIKEFDTKTRRRIRQVH